MKPSRVSALLLYFLCKLLMVHIFGISILGTTRELILDEFNHIRELVNEMGE